MSKDSSEPNRPPPFHPKISPSPKLPNKPCSVLGIGPRKLQWEGLPAKNAGEPFHPLTPETCALYPATKTKQNKNKKKKKKKKKKTHNNNEKENNKKKRK